MNTQEIQAIVNRVVEIGETQYHFISLDISTSSKASQMQIFVLLKDPHTSTAVANVDYVYGDKPEKFHDKLNIWAEIFAKERELYDAN